LSTRASQGDLIAVPVVGYWALGRVIFVSQHLKDIMLVEFRGPFRTESANWNEGDELGFFYTAATKFHKRGWKIVGTDSISGSEMSKSLRLVADEVWEQDTFKRKATPEDKARIRIMGVDGFIRVERLLARTIQSLRNS
jgi:hypothetical protein